MGAILILFALAAGMVALAVAVRSYRAERDDFLRHGPAPLCAHPERTGIAGLQEVALPGPRGLRLAAWYLPPRLGATVVLAHGTGADRSSMVPEIAILAEAGLGALALDLPGQGASEGRSAWGADERASISAAIDWLVLRPEVDAERIGGFGMSLGAYIMAQAAVLDQRLRAVVLGAPPADIVAQTGYASRHYGFLSAWPALLALRLSGMPINELRPLEVIGRIAPRALFIIAGERDPIVAPDTTRALYSAAREPKQLWIVGDAGHCDFAVRRPVEYASRVCDFLLCKLCKV